MADSYQIQLIRKEFEKAATELDRYVPLGRMGLIDNEEYSEPYVQEWWEEFLKKRLKSTKPPVDYLGQAKANLATFKRKEAEYANGMNDEAINEIVEAILADVVNVAALGCTSHVFVLSQLISNHFNVPYEFIDAILDSNVQGKVAAGIVSRGFKVDTHRDTPTTKLHSVKEWAWEVSGWEV